MLDLTKIEKPFGLLDKETQNALRLHYFSDGVVEMVDVNGRWAPVPSPLFIDYYTYRAKPQPRVIKAKYGVGKAWSDNELPSISNTNFGAGHWRAMTGEVVVGDDGWPTSITLKREGAE